jgi:peptide-methionine (R)-S-oxide reductase
MTQSSLGFDLTVPSTDEINVLAAKLTPEARRILLDHGTEAAFCGGFVDHKDNGLYVCGLCALPLFDSPTKFHSKSGWPSFYDPIARDHIAYLEDKTYGMVRVEIRCGRCDSHLGHVFPDGPKPSGDRYCLNSVAMNFVKQGEPLPDLLGRGDPESL